MSRWLAPFALLLLLLAGAFYYQSRQAAHRAGFPAPDFALPGLDGRTYRLSDLRGNVVFVNVWTTWCPPCREEMPAMELLHRRLRGRDFVMLAVSQDDKGRDAVEPFVRQMRLTFPVLLDPEGSVSRRYGVTGYPETFVIDRAGQVVRHIIGPEHWDTDAAYGYFLDLIETPVAEATLGDGSGPAGS